MSRFELQNRTKRAFFLFALVVLLLITFMFRLIQLQVVQHDRWANRSTRNHVSKRVLEMKRGNIFDRNGAELALSVDTYSVFIFSRELKSLPEAANIMASVLPMTREEIISKVGDRNGYIQIYKDLEPNLGIKLQRLNIPGVILESHYRRYYPQKSLAANLIGFTGIEKKGLEGMEKLFDKTLRGYPGLAVQEDISLSESGPARMRVVTPPMGGSNINLSIDAFIQHTLEAELAKLVADYDPIDASAIVMDPHSGEILGMACLPSYDLNEFGSSKPEERRNRTVTDIYEPGSCIKILAVASAIENNMADRGTRFYCRGFGELKGRRVRCHGSHGLIDIDKAIGESCNAAMVQISQMLEPAMLFRTFKNFGLGDPTGIEVLSESPGILKPPSRWSGFSATSMCIGQELAATSMQLVQAYSAIANGGTLVKPRLVKRISSPDGDINQEFKTEELRRVISPQTAKWLRQMLMGVVETGTGKQARIDDYTVGGKTSTAQKANPAGGYFNEKVVVSFIGMAPAIEPKIVLLVAVNEPKGDEKTLYGGKITAPAFARISNRILKYMKVPPDRTITTAAREKQLLQMTEQSQTLQQTATNPANLDSASKTADIAAENAEKSGNLPDFTGFSLRKAMRNINSMNLKGIYEGHGIVIKQSPSPGKPVPASKIVTLTLTPDPKD